MSMLETVYHWLDTALCLAGILFNTVLIYCVQTQSPKTIATYSFLLMNCAVSDMLTCLVTLFVAPRLMVQGDTIYYIANGFCTLFGAPTCFYGYGVMVNLYGHLTVSQLASFVYRWYILKKPIPSKRAMSVVIFLIATPTMFAFFVGTLPFIVMTCCKSFKEEIAQVHPELDVDLYTTFGVPHAITDLRAAVPTTWVSMPVFPITVAVFCIRSRILSYLDQQSNLSDQTKKMHRNLLKALTLQALLPPVYLIGMTLFFIDVVFQLHHPILEYGLYFLCGWIPILAPLFPLYFVGPYRKFLTSVILNKPLPADSAPSGKTSSVVAITTQQRY